MQKKVKQDLEFQDYASSKGNSQIQQQQNNQSRLQESYSLQQVNLCTLNPMFFQASPQQPIDLQESEDIRDPTMTNNVSRRTLDQLFQRSFEKKIEILNHDVLCGSSSAISSRFLSEKEKLEPNQEKIKIMIEYVKSKLFNSIHYSKYNDPLINQQQEEFSSFRYHYFSIYIFLITIISNLLTITVIPIVQVFETSSIIIQIEKITIGIKLLAIAQDLYFKRGPFKMIKGKVILNYQNSSKIYLDSIRLGLLVVNSFISFDSSALKIIFLFTFWLFDFVRVCENFENIYKSTHFFVILLQIWVTFVISLACLLRVFDDEQQIPLSESLKFSISLVTNNVIVSFEINHSNSIVVSIYLILSYLCILYTSIICFIWVKPELELFQEKERLLKGFIQLFSEKCKNQELLRRCYSYLNFRIDVSSCNQCQEDLGRAKELLMKKLSPDLQNEIDLSLRTIMIDKIELMKKFSFPFKQQLIYVIEQVTFNPEDNIIIEHQAEDIGLYYILNGEVKVQFSGSSLGNNKRSVTRLSEGQAFGQYSFISGIPSTLSIFSCGVTTLMKINRSDFLEIIANYPKDNEIFCTMKDNSYYNQQLFECYYCKIRGHYILECKHIQYFPKRANVLEKYLFSKKQQRVPYLRKVKKYLTLKSLTFNQERVHQVMSKQSQDINSDELPEGSYLPYSENPAFSVSYMSNTGPLLKQSQDQQQVSNSNANGESNDYIIPEQEINLPAPIPPFSGNRQNSYIMSRHTAGFIAGQDNFYSSINKDEKEMLQQLSGEQQANFEIQPTTQHFLPKPSRTMPNKLTFQFQNDDAAIQDFNQSQLSQINLRQTSLRSHTYTKSLSKDISKDISNNPSSNSRNDKSLKLSSQIKYNGRKSSSENTQQNQNRINRKSNTQKTGTKCSNQNQMSQFQALQAPDNPGCSENDVLFNKFERMELFTIYYSHNNFNEVIQRYATFMEKRLKNQKKKKIISTPYSINCFVASKIKKAQRHLKN